MATKDKKPVIVLAFSNDKDNYLQMIVQERKSIFSSLQNLYDEGILQINKEENTSMDDLFNTFIRYNNQVCIFHYGGHADGSYLQLEKGAGNSELVYANGLAQLLGQEENLKLVFLNGCATKGQVELLLQSGVKLVIATSVPINDDMAVDFSGQFYKKLATDATVEESFITAKSYIAAKYGEKREIGIHRDIHIKSQTNKSNELPWGIYYKDDNKDVLNWKLSELTKGIVPPALANKIEEIRNKIALNQTKNAIDLFLELTKDNVEQQTTLHTMSQKFTQVKEEERRGTIRSSQASIIYAQINFGLLSTINEFEELIKKA